MKTSDDHLRLVVNGRPHQAVAGSTMQSLIDTLGLAGRRVAVERNRELVKRDAWAATALADGDEIEILHFVGGG